MSVILLVSPYVIRDYQAWKAEGEYPLRGIVYQLAIMVAIAIGMCWLTQQTPAERRVRGGRTRSPHPGVGWVRHIVQRIGQWMVDISKPIYARPPLPCQHLRPTPMHRGARAPTALGNPGGIHTEMAGSTPPSAAAPPRVVGRIPLSYMG
ncbi:hypothetical protein C8J57DRAFT_1249965 [Mycena rebaudengoi]|nr:hypothetical protein C8J57DRAFT_1249965 [Mycena rebaudengoi]